MESLNRIGLTGPRTQAPAPPAEARPVDRWPGPPPGTKPIRVGFVVHVMQVAGAEVLTRELIHRLDGRIAPTILCLDAVGQIGEELAAEGVDVVCLGRRQPGRDWGVARRMAAAVRERELDVVHAHQYTPFFYAAVSKLLCSRPRLVLTEHGRHYPDRVNPLRRAVNRLVLDQLASAVTACSQFSADGLRKADGFRGGRIEVIDNGIEAHLYGPPANKVAARKRVGLDADRKSVIHVARHHPVKDQATLLRGFAAAALPGVDLLMVGDGPLRPDLERLAGELGVTDRVKFLGIRADIPDLMRAADVFTLTSLSEAASLTLMEAMATAIPAAVTSVGGNGEIVRHEREGLLFPRRDVAGCAAAFRRLFREPGLAARLGAAGRLRVLEKYRLERTVAEYYQLYCRLTGRAPV
jgi:glycosyltransferase involved in cell wall biosynthesis